jgi:hypothetical protein
LVPAAAVVVATPNGTLTFEPLITGANPLELEFRFERPGGSVEGALRLRRPDDPLTLRVVSGADDTLLGEAWAAALIVYAELTCTELDDAAERSRPHGDRRLPHHRGSIGSKQRAAAPRPIRAVGGNGHVQLLSATSLQEAIRQLEAVAGHLRRLRPGTRCSDDARRAAEAAGVALPDGFTWVRPHQRGASMTVRVSWPSATRLW